MQCAALNTRSGAISEPLQNVPREPIMVTTDLPMPSSVAGAPSTIAEAGISETDRRAETRIMRMASVEPSGHAFVNGPDEYSASHRQVSKQAQIVWRPPSGD
jgi:hypothetical protein